MPPLLATIVFFVGIIGLFILEGKKESKSSPALWIPVIWTFIGASREVSLWFGGGAGSAQEAYADGSPLDRALYMGLMVASVVVLWQRGQQTGAFFRVNGPILAFFIYGLISVLWSDFPLVALKRLIKAFGNVLMVLVVLTDPDRPMAIKRFLAYTAFLVIPLSVLLVKYYPELGRGYSGWTGAVEYMGVSTGKNALGWDCLVFGLATLWRVLEEFKERKKGWLKGPIMAHGVVLGMALWLLSISSSAAAMGNFAIGTCVMILCTMRWFRMKPFLVHTVVVGIIAICVFGIVIDTDVGLVQAAGKDSSLTDRTYLWHDLLQMDINPLFGTGFESFWLGTRLELIWEKFTFRPNQAHNGYIETYLTLGWVGLVFLGWKILWGYKNAVGALHGEQILGKLKVPIVVATVILNLTEATFKVVHPVWIVFLLMVMMVPNVPAQRQRPKPLQPFPAESYSRLGRP